MFPYSALKIILVCLFWSLHLFIIFHYLVVCWHQFLFIVIFVLRNGIFLSSLYSYWLLFSLKFDDFSILLYLLFYIFFKLFWRVSLLLLFYLWLLFLNLCSRLFWLDFNFCACYLDFLLIWLLSLLFLWKYLVGNRLSWYFLPQTCIKLNFFIAH